MKTIALGQHISGRPSSFFVKISCDECRKRGQSKTRKKNETNKR